VLGIAPRLLGAVVEHRCDGGSVAVRLTEVEAYAGPEDPGSHARHGRTRRTAVMFGPPGYLYVYFTYGMHWCVNIVCGPPGSASAVLLRAGEVIRGTELARSRRPAAKGDRDLARGPARLAAALGIDGALDGTALAIRGRPQAVRIRVPGDPLSQSGGANAADVSTGPRVGVSGPGGDGVRYPWRFWLTGDPTVSTYRPGRPAVTGPAVTGPAVTGLAVTGLARPVTNPTGHGRA
jgi:DNA-3-methyladenine glycosylase